MITSGCQPVPRPSHAYIHMHIHRWGLDPIARPLVVIGVLSSTPIHACTRNQPANQELVCSLQTVNQPASHFHTHLRHMSTLTHWLLAPCTYPPDMQAPSLSSVHVTTHLILHTLARGEALTRLQDPPLSQVLINRVELHISTTPTPQNHWRDT